MPKNLSATVALLFELLRLPVAIVSAEVAMQIQRTARIVLWMLVLGFFGVLAVLMTAVMLVIALWDQRLLAAAAVALLFVVVAIVAAWRLRRQAAG